jgi:prokaryotic YEATS domain
MLVIAAVSGAGFSASSQAGLVELRQRYESGACNHDQDRMVEDLRAYRRELWRKGRRNLQADFMLASCLCPNPGAAALSKLPARYRGMSTKDTEQIRRAANECRGGHLARYLPPGTGIAFVGGKGSMREELVKHEHSQMTPEATLEYEKRLFPRGDIEQAVESLRRRGFQRVSSGDNFLVTGDYGRDELRSINALMDQVLQRLDAQYGLEPPRTLITVYLVKTREQLQRHAREEHDLQISSGTWAYTFPLDASISVWRSGGAGTVGHEVMHALLDQNLPYAPPWLNEGSAALFEEFRMLDGNRIQGTFRRDHWRIPFLKPREVPRLGDLLTMDWEQLDDTQRFQVNHATAKMFAMYLQEQGKLGSVLNAYKGRDLFELGDDTRVVEQALGMGIAQLEKTFQAWLRTKLGWSDNTLTDQQVFDQLRLDNSARFLYQRSGQNWYQWTAFIAGPREARERVARVRYLLHPTFTPSERLGDASRPGHPLTTSGWGVFPLRALVTLDSGRTREYAHLLRFR